MHAGANSIALALYALSWKHRRAGRHLLGVALGLGGATAATAGGCLVNRPSQGSERGSVTDAIAVLNKGDSGTPAGLR